MKSMHIDVANPFPQLVWSFVEFFSVNFEFPLEHFWSNFVKFVGLRPLFEIFLAELVHLAVSHNFPVHSFSF
jgi:hypothetical protein